jgi:hypothetical protein
LVGLCRSGQRRQTFAADGLAGALALWHYAGDGMLAMDRTHLIETLRKYDAALHENGATGLFIFGSRARHPQAR